MSNTRDKDRRQSGKAAKRQSLDKGGNVFQIAIDGPVAAGKGTMAKILADRLGLLYVDTGAMYRTATLLALQNGVDVDEEEKIVELVRAARIDMEPLEKTDQDGGLVRIIVNGTDVSRKIRTKEIDRKVAEVAALARVRRELVKKQQEIAERKGVVMEGRDITYRVLPEADLRIFLDAREEVRIKRRVDQLRAQGREASCDGVAERIRERDTIDRNREVDPLKVVDGVWYLDTSGMEIGEVVEKIVREVDRLREGSGE